MRLVAISGSLTSPFSRRVTQANAARGTIVAIVGTRASCQPMPVLMIVAPAASTALAERDDLVPRAAAVDEIEHRQPEDDDEVAADRLARAAHDLDREADPVLERAAPVVVAMVGARRDELVDEIALRAHDLDAVVAGALREPRAADVGGDRLARCPSASARAA